MINSGFAKTAKKDRNAFTLSAPNERELYKSDNDQKDPTREENTYETILNPFYRRNSTEPIINRTRNYERSENFYRTNDDAQEYIRGA